MLTRNTFNNGGLFTQVKSGAGYEGGNSKMGFCFGVIVIVTALVGLATYIL